MYTLSFLQSDGSAPYLVGLLMGLIIQGLILTLVIAAVYYLIRRPEVTFAQASSTGWVWAVGFLVPIVRILVTNGLFG